MKSNKTLVMSAIALALSSTMAVAAKNTPAPASNSDFIGDLDKSFAITSNYVWRGLSQGGSAPAAQGGVTYNHDSGLSVDVWMSSSAGAPTATPSNEFDITVSYAMQQEKLGLEFGLASYTYPGNPGGGTGSSALELFAGINVNNLNAYLYLDPDSDNGDNIYIEFSADIERFNLAFGVNSNKAAAAKYNQITAIVALTDEMSFSVSQTDFDGAKHELALTYNIPFK